MTDHPNLWAFRLGTRTPCCDRIGAALPGSRVLCRGCGTVYRNVVADLTAAFGRCTDVTPTTPRRLLRAGMIEHTELI